MQSTALILIRRSACERPTDTVLLPSPAGVGLIAVTSTSRPRGGRDAISSGSFALNFPYRSRSSASRPMSAATSTIGRGLAALAMSISDGTLEGTVGFPFRRSNGPGYIRPWPVVHALRSVDVRGAAAQQADEAHAGGIGHANRQAGGPRNGREQGTPNTAAFCTSSKLARLVTTRNPVDASVPARAIAPSTLSSALCRPTSSRTICNSPSADAQAAP